MKKMNVLVTLVLVVLFLAACAESPQTIVADGASSAAEAPRAPALESYNVEDATAGQAAQDQLIIRTGNLEIVVADSEQAIEAITAQVNAAGGWVVESSIFLRGEAKVGNITVRVPAERFEATIDEIEAMAIEVRDSATSGQDVTEEYVDRRARLQNLEATAERVRGFLEEASDVEEALAVNAELSRLEGEIEAVKGRLQYLEQSAAFSTIAVRITPDALAQPIEIGSWRATGVVRSALSALITALQGLATIAIWIVVVLVPLALILLAPLALIGALWRRRRRPAAPASGEQVGD